MIISDGNGAIAINVKRYMMLYVKSCFYIMPCLGPVGAARDVKYNGVCR